MTQDEQYAQTLEEMADTERSVLGNFGRSRMADDYSRAQIAALEAGAKALRRVPVVQHEEEMQDKAFARPEKSGV